MPTQMMTAQQESDLTRLARQHDYDDWPEPASECLPRDPSDIQRHGLTTHEANTVISHLTTGPAAMIDHTDPGNPDRTWALSMTGLAAIAWLASPTIALAHSFMWMFGIFAALLWLTLILDWTSDWAFDVKDTITDIFTDHR